MNDTDDDAAYPPVNSYFNLHSFSSSRPQKLPLHNQSQAFEDSQEPYVDDEIYDVDGAEQHRHPRFMNLANGVCHEVEIDSNYPGQDQFCRSLNSSDYEEGDNAFDDDNGARNRFHSRRLFNRENQKRMRLDPLSGGPEFVPRLQSLYSSGVAATKSSLQDTCNPASEWSDQSTFILLDVWGDRFLQLGRKSLRSNEWFEVAEKVSQASKTLKTEAQCRSRLDSLKKRYIKERKKMDEIGGSTTKWKYFKKMEMLMSSSTRQSGLSCMMDTGEYVFMNPKAYLERSNEMDEMRDSPASSDCSAFDADNDADGSSEMDDIKLANDKNASFKMLADSVKKFGEIYEKIEHNKRIQMMELEKMRMEFNRDLEVQKRQILERAQEEIARVRQGIDEETDVSARNQSR